MIITNQLIRLNNFLLILKYFSSHILSELLKISPVQFPKQFDHDIINQLFSNEFDERIGIFSLIATYPSGLNRYSLLTYQNQMGMYKQLLECMIIMINILLSILWSLGYMIVLSIFSIVRYFRCLCMALFFCILQLSVWHRFGMI